MTAQGTPYTNSQLMALSVEANCDPRTISAFVRGEACAGATYDRIRAVFEAHALPVTAARTRKSRARRAKQPPPESEA